MKGEIYSLLSGKSRFKGTFSRTDSISCIIQAIIYLLRKHTFKVMFTIYCTVFVRYWCISEIASAF